MTRRTGHGRRAVAIAIAATLLTISDAGAARADRAIRERINAAKLCTTVSFTEIVVSSREGVLDLGFEREEHIRESTILSVTDVDLREGGREVQIEVLRVGERGPENDPPRHAKLPTVDIALFLEAPARDAEGQLVNWAEVLQALSHFAVPCDEFPADEEDLSRRRI